jgi:hypothetical protein
MTVKYLGLRSLIYPAPDLKASKAWWSKTLGKDPYFDDGGYVGFDLGGNELAKGRAMEKILRAGEKG